MSYSRFAIYYIPPAGPVADFGAAWLGWDVHRGRAVAHPDVPGLPAVTATPRKYGFHATLKPPFRVAEGADVPALQRAVSALAARLAPARCDGLALATMGRFLALRPRGDASALNAVAAACVRELDAFRAPAQADELARRRRARLSPRQETLLERWGYPYVMEEFRFHMTLTGKLTGAALPQWTETLERLLPELPAPFVLDQIALCGEREGGPFELIGLYPLTG